MNKLQLSRVLMAATILLLTIFEGYWLNKLYQDEHKSLRNNVDVAFRGAIDKLQRSQYSKDSSLIGNRSMHVATQSWLPEDHKYAKKDSIKAQLAFRSISPAAELRDINPERIKSITVLSEDFQKTVPPPALVEILMKAGFDADSGNRVFIRSVSDVSNDEHLGKKGVNSSVVIRYGGDSNFFRKYPDSIAHAIHRVDLPLLKAIDSLKKIKVERNISIQKQNNVSGSRKVMLETTDKDPQIKKGASPIFSWLINNKTVNDSLSVQAVDSAYKIELTKAITRFPPYRILFSSYADSAFQKRVFEKDSNNTKEVVTSKVFTGFNVPYSYQASFDHVGSFILKKMQLQIGGSFLLLVFVIISFVIMYRSLLAQQKLTDIKNDFISNITHELKTPIATVNVAIEALRNFNAIQSPERTREYLDISASELQRLSLLVDKVLKLSMFENKKVELRKEQLDLQALVQETMNTMRLQFEKQNADVTFKTNGIAFLVNADKLHITSVIYNLLDNALKYSQGKPVISVSLLSVSYDQVKLKVSDQGIGIEHQYQPKVFDKFFRVPMGNKHNIKGYGLGLSYVAEIVKRHNGQINVESILGKGSTFIVTLPTGGEELEN